MKPKTLSEDVRKQLHLVRVDKARTNLGNFPDFLIVGPQRTGTTWLFHNLKEHPEIFLPQEKELYYFSTLGMPDHRRYRFVFLEEYLRAMGDTAKSKIKKSYDSLRKVGRFYVPKVRGEATASYAALPPNVIEDIALLNPEMKVILMIRDPIDRAWSHARKDLTTDVHTLSDIDVDLLSQLLFKDQQRELALYRTLIENWRMHLHPGHLFVGAFDSIASKPERLLTAIHSFLNVTTGSKYFGRHLRERINPAPARQIPPTVERLLRDLLDQESREYRELVNDIETSGQVSLCY